MGMVLGKWNQMHRKPTKLLRRLDYPKCLWAGLKLFKMCSDLWIGKDEKLLIEHVFSSGVTKAGSGKGRVVPRALEDDGSRHVHHLWSSKYVKLRPTKNRGTWQHFSHLILGLLQTVRQYSSHSSPFEWEHLLLWSCPCLTTRRGGGGGSSCDLSFIHRAQTKRSCIQGTTYRSDYKAWDLRLQV